MVDFFHCNWDQIFNLVCLNIQSLLKSVIVVIKIYEIELKMAIARGHCVRRSLKSRRSKR